jgi:hypothetical protein
VLARIAFLYASTPSKNRHEDEAGFEQDDPCLPHFRDSGYRVRHEQLYLFYQLQTHSKNTSDLRVAVTAIVPAMPNAHLAGGGFHQT